ncbi:MAG: hypothetical protein KC620_19015 [Myxococcales bacterium]|nr:hypothetical protein [Myxococcales bacterium]
MRGLTALIALIGMAACDDGMSDAMESLDAMPLDAMVDATPSVATATVGYRLEWDTSRVEPAEAGWSVTTDLGYRVTLTRGYLVSYQASLVPCSQVEATQGALDTAAQVFFALIGVSTAHAGHDDVPDPTRLAAPRIESLLRPTALDWGELVVPGTTYCQAHYVVARADDSAAPWPRDVEMSRVSAYIEGTWQQGDAEPVAFTVNSSLANGRLVDLFPEGHFGETDAALTIDTAAEGALVLIRRDLGGLFDGIDFATADDRTVERTLLTTLIDGLVIEVVTGADDAP